MSKYFLIVLFTFFAWALSVQVTQGPGFCTVKLEGSALAVLLKGDIKPSEEFDAVIPTDGYTLLLSKTPKTNPTLGQISPGSSVEVLQVLTPDEKVYTELGNYTCAQLAISPQPVVARSRTTTTHTTVITTQPQDQLSTAWIAAAIILISAAVVAILLLKRR